jgi:hypothetical protein
VARQDFNPVILSSGHDLTPSRDLHGVTSKATAGLG